MPTKPSSVTSLVDALECRGLVVPRRDADDRRKQVVAITKAGRDAVNRFVPEEAALQTAVMPGLNEAERAELTRLLLAVSRAAAALDGDPVVAAAVVAAAVDAAALDGPWRRRKQSVTIVVPARRRSSRSGQSMHARCPCPSDEAATVPPDDRS